MLAYGMNQYIVQIKDLTVRDGHDTNFVAERSNKQIEVCAEIIITSLFIEQ